MSLQSTFNYLFPNNVFSGSNTFGGNLAHQLVNPGNSQLGAGVAKAASDGKITATSPNQSTANPLGDFVAKYALDGFIVLAGLILAIFGVIMLFNKKTIIETAGAVAKGYTSA